MFLVNLSHEFYSLELSTHSTYINIIVYTALQLPIGLYIHVLSWPITSLESHPWDRRKSQTIVLYNSTSLSRRGDEFWYLALIGQFNSSKLCSNFSLTLRSWKIVHIFGYAEIFSLWWQYKTLQFKQTVC